MQRKFNQKPVYLTERSKLHREFIYLHMSNHYRRIVNAKKAIDNSPPTCFKIRRPSTSITGVTRPKINRNFETLILTDRSLSTNSNKDSSWGAESFAGGSRYHARCVPEPPPNVSSPKLSCDMELIDRITYDTKHGPSAYGDKCCTKTKEHQIDRRSVTSAVKENKFDTKPSPVAKRSLSTAGNNERTQKRRFSAQKKLKPSELSPKESKSVSTMRDKFGSNSLKTAESKLRSLRVYYPPRRILSRAKVEKSRSAENGSNLEGPQYKCTKICVCDGNETAAKKMSLNPKEQSVISSRDSAYNGGASSVPESRSPSPDRKSKKECCCCCCDRLRRVSKVHNSMKKKYSASRSPSESKPRATNSPQTSSPAEKKQVSESPSPKLERKTSEDEAAYEKMQNDALYVTFIQDITTEILEKNLYTNKALRKVMKKHLQNNLNTLDKDRMVQELENLRIQLGIPEEKGFFDDDVQETESLTDLVKSYPVISDSEFVMPVASLIPTPSKSLTDESSHVLLRSISEVFNAAGKMSSGSDTDQEDASTAKPKGKAPEGQKQGHDHEMSSEDSDRPSDPKKRSGGKTRRPKSYQFHAVSSSDSEASTNVPKKFTDNQMKELLQPRDASHQKSDKLRNVSFRQGHEKKYFPTTKATLNYSEESVMIDTKNAPPKQ